MSSLPFHLKYRPPTLSAIVGHEKTVGRLQGILKTKKVPNALMFLGPTSAGKTTLARAFAADLFRSKVEGHQDYYEMNAADARGIDDIRQLLDIARLMPTTASHRVIVLDEVQQLTPQAMQATLKMLEQPPKKTLFILCSMEPEKFGTGPGRAIANRCQQFVLEAHSVANVCKHLWHIVKAEELTYVTKAHVKKIAENSNGEMRTAANLLEATSQWVASLEEVPDELNDDDLLTVLRSTESADDEVAIRVLIGVYGRKFSYVQKALLDASDLFGLIKKLTWLNTFMLNDYVLKGARHQKVWATKTNVDLKTQATKLVTQVPAFGGSQLSTFAATQSALVGLAQQASAFQVAEINLISSGLYNLITTLKNGDQNGNNNN